MNSLSPVFNKLDKYFDECINILCSRCGGTRHSKGLIHTFLTPIVKNNYEFYNKYFEDYEHGLFHGIMCGFIISVIHKDKNLQRSDVILEKEYSSAFIHDILKTNGVSQEEHDSKLIDIYPYLKKETYLHSNPPLDCQDEYLIIADRIELTRYSDYNSWVDEKYKNIFLKMEISTKKLINDFYSNVRKTLLYFYKNSNNIFLRHGLEKIDTANYDKNSIFPPKNSYLELSSGFAIEIDRAPFGVKNNWITNTTEGACSNHGENRRWNKIKGYITYDEFINKNGKIIDSKQRDHLYANSNIELSEWVFMYQNTPYDDELILGLIENGIKIIPQQIIQKMFTLIKLLKDRLIVLNGCVTDI